MKKLSTKKALLFSALAMVLCVSMLVGTTFAWFTDSATTNVNKIEAGTLDVALEMWNGTEWVSAEGQTLNFIKASGAATVDLSTSITNTGSGDEEVPASDEILWEPGCTYELPELRIVNKGNLALKYSVKITGINGDAKLNEAITWTFEESNENGQSFLLPEGKAFLNISGHMLETAGNEYQGLTIEGVSITVYATQYTYEYDSNDDQYDVNAPYTSYWNGAVGDVPALVDGERHITSADQFAAIMKATTTGHSNSLYVGETLVLDCDIDFCGRTISGIGGHNDNVAFTFDGNGHTISNFVINGKDDAHKEPQTDGSIEYRYAGLFQQFNGTVKDLTVKNATVIGDQMVGIIASNVDNGGKIIDCKVYDSTVIGARKVGAISGYIAGAGCEISGCYAENVNVYALSTETNQSAEMVGYINNAGGAATVYNEYPVNVNVYRGSVSTVTNESELNSALNGEGKAVFLSAGSSYQLPGTIGKNAVIIGNGAEVKAPVSEGFNRIFSTGATFYNVVFKDEGNLWIKDAASFVGCTFKGTISNAEPVVGTVTFENCTFEKAVHFAPASGGASVTDKFFEAKCCIFNGNLTVQGFEKVTLKNCTLNATNWAGANMISYCPVTFENCTLAKGVRLASGMTSDDVVCVGCNVTVKLP